MTPAEVLAAIRNLVSAAEEAGWDTIPHNREILQRGREAYSALLTVMADADEEQEPYDEKS